MQPMFDKSNQELEQKVAAQQALDLRRRSLEYALAFYAQQGEKSYAGSMQWVLDDARLVENYLKSGDCAIRPCPADAELIDRLKENLT